MRFTLPAEVEQQVERLVRRGEYPNAQAVFVDAIKALVRERERRQVESLLDASGVDERQIEQLLREAEESGGYTEMTSKDWEDIEREGLAAVNTRKLV